MASTFDNDLQLEEMATGENAGSWGTKTNTNLELIADAFGYGTATIGNADTSLTMPEGSDTAANKNVLRSLFLKITSSASLTTTRVVTLLPNTVSKVWLIENATSGSQTITIKQGSGATINILNGQTKIIATDGAGAGAAVTDLSQDLAITDLFIDDDLSLQSDGAIINFGADDDITLTHAADTSLTLGGAGSTTGLIVNNTATDGDPFLAFALSGTQKFTMGVDDGDSDKFKIGTTAIGTDTRLTIDSSGRVLIGTVTARADLFNTSATAPLQVEGTTGNTASVSIVRNSNDDNGPQFILGKSNGASVGSDTIVTDDALLGRISYQGADGSELVEGARIEAQIDGTPAANDMPGRLQFYTTPSGSATPSERVRILSTGDVGIGTGGGFTVNDITGSGYGLVIGSSSASSAGIQIRTGTSGSGNLYFGDNSGSDAGRYDGFIQYSQSTRQFNIGTAQGTRFVIDSAGNVGIGNLPVDPDTLLHLEGTNNASAVNNALRFTDLDTAVVADQKIGRIEFETSDTSNPGVNLQIDGIYGGSGGGSELVIRTGVAGSLENRMFIQDVETVFNEDGGDNDFRVESDNYSHMLFVDAAKDQILLGSGDLNDDSVKSIVSIGGTNHTIHFAGGSATANTNGGGFMTSRQKDDSSTGWVTLGAWDGGTSRQLYYGGGNWGVEEATLHIFYAGSYDAGAGNATEQLRIHSGGVTINDLSNDLDFRVESNSSTHAFFVEGNDGGGTPSIGFGISDPTKLGTSGTAPLGGGSGAILQLAGDDSQIRMANHVIHSDNGGNTIFHIRNNYGLTNSGAELSLESGHITFQSGTSFDERMRLDPSGNLLFEHTDFTTGWGVNNRAAIAVGANYKFWSSRNSTTSRGHMIFYNPNGAVGSITTDGSSTLFNTSSDYRLKENVADISDGITRVKQLAPKRFNFIADANKTVDGFLAHEAATVVPEAVTGTKDAVDADGNPEYQGIDQAKLVPLLTAALKEAIAKIETLETKVTALENA